MARQLSVKVFYAVLAVIAVAGTVGILMATRSDGGPAAQTLAAPFSLDSTAFPGYVLGSDSAPVEIVEYADFACSHCATFTILQGPDIKRRLVETGLARLRFRGFALYQASLLPLNAAACAGEQGRFWEMHDQLMFNQRAWFEDPNWPTSRHTRRLFRDYAGAAGVDLDGYDRCMEEERYTSRILATREEITSLGINSTPTFEIGPWRVVGGDATYDSLRVLVEKAAGLRQ